MSDVLTNWTNNVYHDHRADMTRIARKFSAFLGEGFSIDQAVDLLLGEGEEFSLVENMANFQKKAQRDSAPQQRRLANKYADVQEHLEEIVTGMPSNEAMAILAGGKNNRLAIVQMSEKEQMDLENLFRYAAQRKDRSVLAEVHKALQPFVEESLVDSKMLAKEAKEKGLFKYLRQSSDAYLVHDESDNRDYSVNLASTSCTCPRYVLGGFNYMGLPCEHIIEVARKFDPTISDGTKKVFAHKESGARFGWCDRYSNEVKIEVACQKAECPFYEEDCGEYIKCAFATEQER